MNRHLYGIVFISACRKKERKLDVAISNPLKDRAITSARLRHIAIRCETSRSTVIIRDFTYIQERNSQDETNLTSKTEPNAEGGPFSWTITIALAVQGVGKILLACLCVIFCCCPL
jgi:hypothetical protein